MENVSTNETTNKSKSSVKATIQKFGSYLSSMIMPNIAAFIAWGILTAMFQETGWLPNEDLAQLVDPMMNYLLPLLIAYSGGGMIHGQRGSVIGTIGTMGVIIASDIPMFLGAMIMGPLGGWLIKKFDETFEERISQGFEMLVNNFSLGILGFFLAIFGYFIVGPAIGSITIIASLGIQNIISLGVLPLVNVITEPAKVLFLNNAVNHGIFTPLGAQQAEEIGKSILYLVSINPGVGGGMLLSYLFFGKGSAKSSASGALIIQFLGGIHEMYFPYVLMKPLMALSVIAGGVTGTAIFQLFNVGLSGPASPGSIISVVAMTSPGDLFGVLFGVFGAAAVSFGVGALVLKFDHSESKDFEESKKAVKKAKRESKGQYDDEKINEGQVAYVSKNNNEEVPKAEHVEKIIFACDAGMGSSAMGASLLKRKAKSIDLNIPITNSAIGNLKDEQDSLVITQEELTPRARRQSPSSMHVSVGNFLDSDQYDNILAEMVEDPFVEPDEVSIGATSVEDDNVNEVSQMNQEAKNLDNIGQVFFPYESKVGKSTMAASLFRNELIKEDIDMYAQAIDLYDIKDSDKVLVIGDQETVGSTRVENPHVQYKVIEDILDPVAYKQLFE